MTVAFLNIIIIIIIDIICLSSSFFFFFFQSETVLFGLCLEKSFK